MTNATNSHRCRTDDCELGHCGNCGGHTYGNEFVGGHCADCHARFEQEYNDYLDGLYAASREADEVWTVVVSVPAGFRPDPETAHAYLQADGTFAPDSNAGETCKRVTRVEADFLAAEYRYRNPGAVVEVERK